MCRIIPKFQLTQVHDYIILVSSNVQSKPVEKSGRKAVSLKLECNDRQAAVEKFICRQLRLSASFFIVEISSAFKTLRVESISGKRSEHEY